MDAQSNLQRALEFWNQLDGQSKLMVAAAAFLVVWMVYRKIKLVLFGPPQKQGRLGALSHRDVHALDSHQMLIEQIKRLPPGLTESKLKEQLALVQLRDRLLAAELDGKKPAPTGPMGGAVSREALR